MEKSTWYQRNREKAIASAKAWREANPERFKANQREWKKKNRAQLAHYRRLTQWRYHGIELTAEEYDKMWAEQQGRCKLCDKYQKTRRLAADHDHETGRVRGLLCTRCNVTLGTIERYLKNPDIKARTDRYLQSDSPKETGLPKG